MKLEDQVCSLELARKLKELKAEPIQGFEDRYFLTKEGKVFSTKYGRVSELKRSYDKRGYWRIHLFPKGAKKAKSYIIHRLVAKQYIPNPNRFKVVNHKDGNKNNNSVSNLEWCTREYNDKHKIHVLGQNGQGEKNGHWGYRKAKLYPNPALRNKLCELGIPRYKHNLAELGAILPHEVGVPHKTPDGFWQYDEAAYSVKWGPCSPWILDTTEADARAIMLIYLIKNNLYSVEKDRKEVEK